MHEEFDYIIVGAGSAGCVLANRLGADTSQRILVLEAGPMDYDLMIHVPAGVYSVWHKPGLNWNYDSEPEPELDSRQVFIPRGKVLGGSSSINSMVYMRGHPLDYDGWASRPGMADWAFDRCLPYFRAGECSDRGGSVWRGDAGPLGVSQAGYDNPLFDAFVAAGPQAGQGQTDDPNGYQPEGTTRLDATRRHGRRCSAAIAHLRPALKRGNVTLVTGAVVQRVVIENGRATGVEYIHRGKRLRGQAGRDVILSGGALNSPQLLMLSGIGPAGHLTDHGIPVAVDSPGVGQNLQDHACIILQYACPLRFPLHVVDHPLRKAAAGLRWVFMRDGAAASNIWEAGGLIRSDDTVAYADLQYHFAPVAFEYDGPKITLMQGFAIHVDQLRPRSRGAVTLRSADPAQAPRLNFNFFSEPADLDEMVQGVLRTRELISQPAFEGLRGAEITPGPEVHSLDQIRAWVRQASETDFHPSGTCRMGVGEDAVVGPDLKVHGVEGLRVVDASVMPRITSGNLNAPTQMIAAKAADIIARRDPLPAEQAAYAFRS
ncbi:choline dehydrogenase [Aliisedimentitalea scapharcae]|uniref:Choline dehydrogenase n=1 Tax=Aliisedimentitalea scapharcae TaxID=1524259 RepID=A0ABZ2XVC9_9RHOB